MLKRWVCHHSFTLLLCWRCCIPVASFGGPLPENCARAEKLVADQSVHFLWKVGEEGEISMEWMIRGGGGEEVSLKS